MAAQAYRMISKKMEKVRYYSFNLCRHSLLHIGKQVLTNFVRNLVELEFFGHGNIAVSYVQTTSWMCFYCCLL